jgi:capsular polysaccharide biosynthesis protein
MGLRDYWRVFRRRAWIPLVLVAATVVTAGALALATKPGYTATATVEASAPLLSTGSTSNQFVFSQVAMSNSLATDVAHRLSLSLSVDQIIGQIHVSSPGSGFYRVSVTDANPQYAAALANAVAQQAVTLYRQLGAQVVTSSIDTKLAGLRDSLRKKYQDAETARLVFQQQHPATKDVNLQAQGLVLQLEAETAATNYQGILQQISRQQIDQLSQVGVYDANIIDQAVAKPDTSGRVSAVALASGLALIVGIGLIFLLEFLDNAVRHPEVAEQLVGAPVIAVIPRATGRSLRTAKGGR